jgi:hypothetical protein
MNVRSIIKETIENLLDKQDLADKFDKDIKYLNGFKLIKTRNDEKMSLWVFECKVKNYILRFFIEKNKIKNTWASKIFIYWKEISKNLTNARGKEYEFSFGPFDSYESMVDEINNKLKNNPNLSLKNFIDDNRLQFDLDLIYMLKLLQKNSSLLFSVNDKIFNKIKGIYEKIKESNSDEDLRKFIAQNAYDIQDKQRMILDLQILYKLDFFNKKEKVDSIF